MNSKKQPDHKAIHNTMDGNRNGCTEHKRIKTKKREWSVNWL